MKTNLLTKTATDRIDIHVRLGGIRLFFKDLSQFYSKSRKYLGSLLITFAMISASYADYTVPAGTTVNASSITGYSGVLYIYGTLNVDNNVSLLGFTSVVISGTNSQINWSSNYDITFSAGTTFDMVNNSLGLTPAGTNGSKRLIVGSITIAVSNENANNASFSFAEFNNLKGLPVFTVTANSPVCFGNSLNVTVTPSKTSNFNFHYVWSSSPALTFSPNSSVNSGAVSSTVSSPALGTYTVTCTINDEGGDVIATKSTTVTVSSLATISRTSAVGTTTQTVCSNTAITPITYSVGGSATGATVTGLPSGVTGTYSAGVFTISGSSATAGSYNYTVTTTGGNCPVSTSGTLTVNAQTITLTSGTGTNSQTSCLGTAISPITYSTGGTATGASVTGLPSGVTGSYSAGVYTISGTPSVAGTFNYTVTTSGTCSAVTAAGTITVSTSQTLSTVSQSSMVCSGYGATINLSGLLAFSSNTINYSVNGVAQTPVSGVNADAAGSASFTTTVLTYANNGQILLVSGIANGTCTTPFSKSCTLSVAAAGTWLGNNTNWQDPSNWCNGIPTAATDALLLSGKANYPLLNTGIGNVHNIDIRTGASLTVSTTIKIGGTITNAGTLDAQNGTVELNSISATQNISGSWFVNRSIKNLKISTAYGVSVSSAANDILNITGSINFGNVDYSFLYTGDNVALKSTVSGTASVGDITNGGINSGNSITGKMIIERFLPMQNSSVSRRWRLLSTPIQTTGAPTINASWQEGVVNSSVNAPVNPKPGYGTQLTNGNTMTAVTNGFDMGTTASPSIYYLNPGVSPNWVVPSNTLTTSIASNEGYMVFVRGDRSIVINNQFVSANPTTLEVKGNLNTGDVTKSLVTGKQVVGNPYASAIKFDNVVLNGASANDAGHYYYVWDPKTSGSYNVGRFITVSNAGIGSPAVYFVTANSSSITDGTIESGSAIVVESAGGPNTITFHESDKIATSSNVGIASRPAGSSGISSLSALYTNMYYMATDGTSMVADGVVNAYYPEYNDDVDNSDAPDLISFNSKENLSVARNGKLLSIEKRRSLVNTDTIFLELRNMDNRSYRFEFIPKNFKSGIDAFLEDSYTSSKTQINIGSESSVLYDFTINNSIPASSAVNRFRIVFRPAVVLPVTFSRINAKRQEKIVLVEWKVENEVNIQKYIVERSTDGIHFSQIATVNAQQNNALAADYNSLDKTPVEGTNYYRISSVDHTGAISYSQLAKVIFNDQMPSVMVYPTITSNGKVDLKLSDMPAGEYIVKSFNSMGQMLLNKTFTHAGGTAIFNVSFDKSYPKGIYQIKVESPDKTNAVFKILTQ